MIEASGLTKTYGRTVAVNQLSFLVRPGQVTGFLGPNGSGKSTTMRMVLGLDSPDRGQALIDGQRYLDLKHPLRKVGSLLDANWVHPNRTARAHLRWMARANGLGVKRVDEVLDTVGLTSVAGKAAGKFSLGMKQRLGIAGALLGDPEVLLFDEPVNGLDPEGIHWIRTFMKGLAEQGRTVFVSSHLLSEMALTADHLVVIGRGQLISDASTADFISHSTESSVRVRSPQLPALRAALDELIRAQGAGGGAPGGGVPGGAVPGGAVPGGAVPGGAVRVNEVADGLTVIGLPIEQIGELAAAKGIPLHELSPQTGSLEEAFIQLTNSSVEYVAHDAPGGRGPSAPQYTPGPGGQQQFGNPLGSQPPFGPPSTPQGR
ncbi:ABC transporter ATP-binding protein [Nakamurella lactea]|uniref:ABC transporter ATP-binding protein n=1 Tax=Nakamurella lactea TaxID=459515 RepID=UPI0004179F29|nr:ABC transporter ATP-binding protein [Nakamurella lactea]